MIDYSDILPGGRHWSMVLRRGTALTLEDLDGGANVGMLMYNPLLPLERLNLPDSLKCQHTFRLSHGHCLYSDMGRIFCSVVEDTVGWHDAASGTCNAALVADKWGHSSYQEAQNDYLRNGRDSFLIEMAKYGLGRRDLAANVNWFSRVDVDEAGAMTLAADHSAPGARIKLRFEMDTLVLMHSCPHPLCNAEDYPRRPVRYTVQPIGPAAVDDPCRNYCAENQRGFANNELYLMGAL